jgi:hypothetical protein
MLARSRVGSLQLMPETDSLALMTIEPPRHLALQKSANTSLQIAVPKITPKGSITIATRKIHSLFYTGAKISKCPLKSADKINPVYLASLLE